MKYFGAVCVLLIAYDICKCATIHKMDEIPPEERNFEEEQSLLATGVPDNAIDRNRDGQSDPRYPSTISEDDRRPLDNLAEAQEGMLEETVKEKRCRMDDGNLVGLALKRRDTTANLLKKSCDNCMNSGMCAVKGKCESCRKICERYDASLDQFRDEFPNNEKYHAKNSEKPEVVGVPNRLSDSEQPEGGLSYGDNRYYTVGAFLPGPVHALLAKLLNIKDVAPIEELLIMAKTKSNKPIKTIRPVVFDTAHVFTLNRGGPSKLDVELHEVGKGTGSVNAIASQLDREIEKAMEEKQKKSGTTHLAPREIDRIIMRALDKDSNQKPHVSSRTMSEQDEDKLDDPMSMNEMHRENAEEIMLQTPNKQKIAMMDDDEKFQRLIAKNGDSTLHQGHPESQIPPKVDELTGQQSPVHPDSVISTTPKITTTTKPSKRPHGASNYETSSSKVQKTTPATIAKTTKRLKPSPGPEYPFHPDSPIKTTTPIPTTVHSNFPHGKKKPKQQTSTTAKPASKTAQKITSSAEIITTPQPDALPTPHQMENPSRSSHDEFFVKKQPLVIHTNAPAPDVPRQYSEVDQHHIQSSGSPPGHIESNGPLRDESIPRNVETDSSPVMEEEIRIEDQPIEDDDSFVVGEGMDTPKSLYEKYKQLRAWVNENAQMTPPQSVDDTKENLSSNVKGIIDGIITKMDEHLSDIAKSKAIPEDDDKKIKHLVKLPSRNEFMESIIIPEKQRKLDEIFAEEGRMNGQRLSKNLYETHPRSKAAYNDGKWVYERITPKKPPYHTKHRASSSEKQQELMGEIKSNGEVMGPTSVANRMHHQLHTLEDPNSPKSLDPVFSARTQDAQHTQQKDMLSSGPMQQNTDTKLRQDVNSASGTGISDPSSSAASSDPINIPNAETGRDETVACSKEKDDDDDHHMFEILHLPTSHGYYREAERKDDKNAPPLSHHKHRHHQTPQPKQSENPLRQIAEETQEMISDLNKMHKHGKSAHPSEGVSVLRKSDEIPMNDENSKHFPQETNHRIFASNYPESMRVAEEIQEDTMPSGFMEQPMLNNPDMMEQDIIGSPIMRNGVQEPFHQHLTHMGQLIPRSNEHRLSLHSRDVSEQEKHKNMYFIGDGIKLPLNMREHHDGSLHLSVDVKSLCNCKHCTRRQLENGTVIIEAIPFSEQEQQEHEMEIQRQIPKAEEETNSITNPPGEHNHSSEENDSFESDDTPGLDTETKASISRRSLRTKRFLQDNEVDSSILNASKENPDDDTTVPMQTLTRQEIMHRLSKSKGKENKIEENHEDKNSMRSKLKIFTNVLDFMKNLMLDVQSKR